MTYDWEGARRRRFKQARIWLLLALFAGAVADAARLVSEAGANIIGVVCAIWRGDGAPILVALPELPVAAAMTRYDLNGQMSD